MRCDCGECRTCGWYTCSGIVSSAADVLWIECGAWDERSWWSVCMARGGMGGELIGFGLY